VISEKIKLTIFGHGCDLRVEKQTLIFNRKERKVGAKVAKKKKRYDIPAHPDSYREGIVNYQNGIMRFYL